MRECPPTERVQGGRHKIGGHSPDNRLCEVLDFRQSAVVEWRNGVTIRRTMPVQYEV
jgi:hypothetical protein